MSYWMNNMRPTVYKTRTGIPGHYRYTYTDKRGTVARRSVPIDLDRITRIAATRGVHLNVTETPKYLELHYIASKFKKRGRATAALSRLAAYADAKQKPIWLTVDDSETPADQLFEFYGKRGYVARNNFPDDTTMYRLPRKPRRNFMKALIKAINVREKKLCEHKRRVILDILRNSGLATTKTPPKDVDPDELRLGIEVELEHVNDRAIAAQIALDHLVEDNKYYTKLKRASL